MTNKKKTTNSTILVVDDNAVNLDILVDCLCNFGYTVLPVKSGEQALATIRKRRPDIILLDIMMPGLNGFETCRRLKENDKTKDIPVIFMSALSETVDKVQGFEVGAVDYVTKPFQQEEILARVKAHLTIRYQQEELEKKNKELEREIIERKWIEEDLRESENKVSSILQTANDGIIAIDENGIIESCNSAAERIFGYDPNELTGQNIKILVPPDHRKEYDGYLAYYLKKGNKTNLEIRREVIGLRKDETIFSMYLSVSEARLNNRRILTGIIHDITARKLKEKEQADLFLELQTYSQELRQKVAKIRKDDSDSLPMAEQIEDGPLYSAGKFNILLAEDNQMIQDSMARLLTGQNYAISRANNGVEILEMIEKGQKFDLILLEANIPKMDGFMVCQKIRQRFMAWELPIILVINKDNIADIMKGFEAGANDYVTKPPPKYELLARIKTHLRLSKINVAYGRFVPREFLKFLKKESIIELKLGDQIEKEMTVLFSDIRSFTELSELMTPQENFNFLNSYLQRTSPLIRQNNGFIDKYIGDSIMALFPETAEDGIQAAIAMKKAIVEYNVHRKKSGFKPIAIGIGLHTGKLILGTVGEEKRMENTVISDAVNLASRLEGLSKFYGVSIIISEKTLLNLPNSNKYNYRFLGRIRVKGKKEVISVFEIFDGDLTEIFDLKVQTLPDFKQGTTYYLANDFSKAKQSFNSVLEINDQDKATHFYLKRCEHFQQYGLPADLNRIEYFDSKY